MIKIPLPVAVCGIAALCAVAVITPYAIQTLAFRFAGVPRKAGLGAGVRFWRTRFGAATFWFSIFLDTLPIVGVLILSDAAMDGFRFTDLRTVISIVVLPTFLMVVLATVTTYLVRRINPEDADRWLEEQRRKARKVEENGR